MKFGQIAFCFVLTMATAGSVQAARQTPVAPTTSDTIKVKLIRQLLEVTGQVKISQQVMNQMLDAMKQQDSRLPDEFWDRLKKKLNTAELIDLLIPVYDKYYTQQDLAGLIAFYKSPLGRKAVSSLPMIARESQTIGQTWGQKKVQELMQEMQKAHGPEKSSRRSSSKAVSS